MARMKKASVLALVPVERTRSAVLQQELNTRIDRTLTELKAYDEDLGLEDEFDMSDEQLEERWASWHKHYKSRTPPK